MASLSSQLKAELNALPLHYQALPTLDQYRKVIAAKSEELDRYTEGGSDLPNRASRATSILKSIFASCPESRVEAANDPLYEAEKQKNWSSVCWLQADSIIKPHDVVEVAFALKIVTFLGCPFAVRSGGHNSNPGCASIGESGVLLDLGLLNKTILSEDKKVASLGPGTTWDKVYEDLEKHELTVVGGRASGVGVGGLILGGGMSHFSNHWGMVADNVKNFQVVLADSTIVQANSEENSDLFKALKGGGPNFGIVTEIEVYTYSDYKVWYKCNVYSAADAEKVMKATVEVQRAMELDDRIGFFLSNNAGFFVAGFVYRGESSGTPPAFQSFDSITPISIAVPETQGTQLSVSQAFSIMGKAKRESGVVTIGVDAELYVELHKNLQLIVADSKFNLVFTIQPIGKAGIEKGNFYGGNCMKISPESQSWLGIMVEWNDDKDDEIARAKIRELIKAIEETSRSRGLLLDFQFMNDAGYDQSPIKSYGKEMEGFLQGQSKKWDPKKIFQKLQNGGHLLRG